MSDRAERRRVLERQETILQSIRDGVYTLDPDGTITWVNEAAVDEFDAGYTRDDLVGAHVSMLMSDADIAMCADIIEELLADDRPTTGRCEIELQTAYGDEIPCELQMTLLSSEDGEFQGTVGVVRDVSERKRRVQQLSVLNRVLRHNIRNRMTVLLGNLDFLESDVDDTTRHRYRRVEEAAESIAALGDKARHLQDIIDTDPSKPTTVDAVEVARASVESFRERYPEAAISFDAPSEQPVKGNDRLGVALEALIENAIVHNDRNPELTITVGRSGCDDGRVAITVADNGPGIPETETSVLFDDREEQLSHGSGLGLWTVRWYVDSHGGDLSFEDNEPRGTVATICLRPE